VEERRGEDARGETGRGGTGPGAGKPAAYSRRVERERNSTRYHETRRRIDRCHERPRRGKAAA
jgi:hypothetical protein